MVKSTTRIAAAVLLAVAIVDQSSTEAFAPSHSSGAFTRQTRVSQNVPLHMSESSGDNFLNHATKFLATVAATVVLSTSLISPAFAEDELAAKYGGKGFDSTLVDQTCLVDKCSLQAKACLADDPSCRKGLTCTAKCMGDNSCITGCMARYGNKNLDNLLKCTIEDNECIKVAILDGGADKYGEEPRAPAPTIRNFNVASMEGTWFKVVGFNPNYDCYACQRNTFTAPADANSNMFVSNNKMMMDVEFSMPRMLPDGSPPPPKNVRETIQVSDDGMFGSKSIGFNDYDTHEVMVFDSTSNPVSAATNLLLGKGTKNEASYARTAHSEGEMFGLSKLTTMRGEVHAVDRLARLTNLDLLSLQSFGRTGTLLGRMMRMSRNSSLSTTMERRDRIPTRARLSTVDQENSRQSPWPRSTRLLGMPV